MNINDTFIPHNYAGRDCSAKDSEAEKGNLWMFLLTLALLLASISVSIWVISESWNIIAVPIFGASVLGFWKAWALLILINMFTKLDKVSENKVLSAKEFNEQTHKLLWKSIGILIMAPVMVWWLLPYLMS
jgi:hypothetical protein